MLQAVAGKIVLTTGATGTKKKTAVVKMLNLSLFASEH